MTVSETSVGAMQMDYAADEMMSNRPAIDRG
jgi:hypothetical protein